MLVSINSIISTKRTTYFMTVSEFIVKRVLLVSSFCFLAVNFFPIWHRILIVEADYKFICDKPTHKKTIGNKVKIIICEYFILLFCSYKLLCSKHAIQKTILKIKK